MRITPFLLLLSALFVPTSALARAQDPAAASAVSNEREQKQKRILHLTGGQTLRGLTRFVEGEWQLRKNGAWHAVPALAVQRFRKETDALKQARELGRGIPVRDSGRRTEYAKWLVGEGLMVEASSELDAVLHFEPDSKAALAVLQSKRFPRPRAGNPEADPMGVAKTLINASMNAGPVDRELLIQSLSQLQSTEAGKQALRTQLRSGLHSPAILRRTFSAHALRRLLPGEELLPLMRRCVYDVSAPVRLEASLAVRAAGDPGLVLPIVKALGSESRAVRTNAAESLGHIGHAMAVPALVTHFANLPQSGGGGSAPSISHIYVGSHFAYVQDFDLEIAQGASIADPIVRQTQDAVVLEARVGGNSGRQYPSSYAQEYRTVYESLKSLTAENPGSSPRDWQGWLTDQGQRFEKKL
jgi:hypothetical protein